MKFKKFSKRAIDNCKILLKYDGLQEYEDTMIAYFQEKYGSDVLFDKYSIYTEKEDIEKYHENFYEFIRNDNYKFIIVFLGIHEKKEVCHSSCLLINNETKKIYKFDPHGKGSKKNKKVNKIVDDIIIKDLCFSEYYDYKYISTDWQLKKGPQNYLQAAPNQIGLCLIYTIFFVQLFLTTNDIYRSEITLIKFAEKKTPIYSYTLKVMKIF